VTSRTTEIQTLIADIDNLLAHKGNLLSKILSGQGQDPRQVLERIRSFLVRCAESEAQASSTESRREPQQQLSPLLAQFVDQSHQGSLPEHSQASPRESVSVESSQFRNAFSPILMSLQAEIQALSQERATLVQEVRQLEQKRLQNHSLSQQLATQEKMISEFLQVLMSRLMTSLTPSRGETTANVPLLSSQKSNSELALLSSQPFLESPEQLERLTRLARELDQKLLALDGTVNVVFEALQRNIHTYDESLSQALARMYSKGVQGEQLLASWLTNLMEQLQQQTASDDSSTYNVHNKTLSPTDSTKAANIQTNNQEPSVEVLQDASNTQELVQLNQDTPVGDSDLKDDEVDEVELLYASLFGSDNFTDPSLDVNSKDEITDVSHESSVNTTISPPTAEITEAVLEPATQKVTDSTHTAFIQTTTPTEDFPPTLEVLPESYLQETSDTTYISPVETTDSTEALTPTPESSPQEVTDTTHSPPIETTDSKDDLPLTIEVQPESSPQEVTDTTHVLPVETTDSTENFVLTPEILPESSPQHATDTTHIHSVETTENLASISEVLPESSSQQATDTTQNPSVEEFLATPEILPESSPQQATDTTHIHSVETTDSVEAIAPTPDILPESPQQATDTTHKPPVETTDSTQNLTPTPESSPQEITESTEEPSGDPPPVTHQVQQVEEAAPTTQDPWFDEPDAGLLQSSYQVTQDTAVENSLDTSFVDITTTSTLDKTPENTSTIEEATKAHDLEQSSDDYTAASLQENLFAQEDGSLSPVPDISLAQAQLRQLEQDLANFDSNVNQESQPVTLSENQAVEKTRTSLDTRLEFGPQEAQIAVAEQEQERTENPDSFVVSTSKPTDNTELPKTLDSVWYLGIDLGTTGISAALLNRSTVEIYPLYWSAQNQQQADSIKHSFRLPAEVYLPTASTIDSETEHKEAIEQTTPADVAEKEISENLAITGAQSQLTSTPTYNLFSAQLKPYLQIAIPYKSEQQKWEPVLQLNEFSTVPVVWVVRSLSKLLLTLKFDSTSTTLGLTAGAHGLSQQNLRNIIDNIAGVICSCPSNWSEQYRFNVREALLLSKLVQHPQQVFFVEEAIASLLSELDGANGEIVELNTEQGSRLAKTSEHPLLGSTLVINIGAACTEMTLVDLPEHLEDLTHSDFMLHGFAYAGKGIEQDIICQLLIPEKWRQSRVAGQQESNNSNNTLPWQQSIPGLNEMQLSSLALEELNLPRPGEPDIADRIRLQQRLESSVLGKAMLDAAIALKLILQHQDSFTLELSDQQWILQRRDLESQVFVPFVRRLNRELNRLLVAKGIPTEAINQAILTGGVASIGAVNRWLRQKLPNAKIIQDLNLGENGELTYSRVAYGLAVLPLHPQVVEVSRQQYTDYFLFTELLRLLPDRSLSFDEVVQLFENRGINTRNCQQRLLAFLEGELPPGLLPSNPDIYWLSPSAKDNPEFMAISSAPLFEKQGNLTYRPNKFQVQSLCRYLDMIRASTRQSLEEPYTVNFAVGVVP
jgi:hypothetical protein